jgi:hypothetical protein
LTYRPDWRYIALNQLILFRFIDIFAALQMLVATTPEAPC